MRKLASIQTIDSLSPIEGRDRIELAKILGWQVIVKKDEFKVGDKCVYIEIDSVLPPRPEFDFLESKKYRIRTMKMAGVLSQGICFPLSILTFKDDVSPYTLDFSVGDDVTEMLGIKQYEPDMDNDKDVAPQNAESKKKNPLMRFKIYRILSRKNGKSNRSNAFPDFISKTDETRIQNIPMMLNDEGEWTITEKVDGCSATYILVRHKRFLLKDKLEYIVCSRNLRLRLKDNSIYWQVSDKYLIESVLKNMIGKRNWIAIQGECIGPRIQGNKYKVDQPRFFAFNLIDPDGRKNSVQAANILGTRGIDFVPIIDSHFKLPKTVDEMLEIADGQSVVGDTIREGLVVRSNDGKQSFKAVSNKFLLKYY